METKVEGVSIVIPTSKEHVLTANSLNSCPIPHQVILSFYEGLGAARNKGASQAIYDLLLMLDDDLELCETFWNWLFSLKIGEFAMAKVADNISTRVFAIHLQDFQRIGGFDESIRYIFEDGDFMIRALANGLHLKVVPNNLFRHIPHQPRQRNKLLLCLLTWEYTRLLLKYKRLLARKGFIRFFLEPFDYRVFIFHFVTKLFAFPFWLLRGIL